MEQEIKELINQVKILIDKVDDVLEHFPVFEISNKIDKAEYAEFLDAEEVLRRGKI